LLGAPQTALLVPTMGRGGSVQLLVFLAVVWAPRESSGVSKNSPVYSLSDIVKTPSHKHGAMTTFNGTLASEYWLIANFSQMALAQEVKNGSGRVDRAALGQVARLPRCAALASNRSALHLRLGDAFNEERSRQMWKGMSIVPPNVLVAMLPNDEPYTVASGIHNEAYKGADKTHPAETRSYLQSVMQMLPRGSKLLFRPHTPQFVDEDFCTFVHADRFYMSMGGFSERAAEARCELGKETMRFVPDEPDGFTLQKYDCTAVAFPTAQQNEERREEASRAKQEHTEGEELRMLRAKLEESENAMRDMLEQLSKMRLEMASNDRKCTQRMRK
jgi:hypothetical protein